jgi:hypothetical protein
LRWRTLDALLHLLDLSRQLDQYATRQTIQ